MSTPRPHSPPRLEGSSEPRKSVRRTPIPSYQGQTNFDLKMVGVPEPGFAGPSNRTGLLLEFFATMKRPADFKCFRAIGHDGTCRTICWLPGPSDQPTGMEVYDAQPMSPEVLTQYLNRQEWSQEIENRFRGVDGRNTPKE